MANNHDRFRQYKIKGYSDYCLVVDDKLFKVAIWCKRRSRFNKQGEWQELNQYVYCHRYLAVWMFKDGQEKGHAIRVHEVVCKAVYGEPKEYTAQSGRVMKEEVCHGPKGMYDNHPNNLRWGTRAENLRDKDRDGTSLKGMKVATAKLTDDDVREIRKRADAGESYEALREDFKINSTRISLIARRKAWKHVT